MAQLTLWQNNSDPKKAYKTLTNRLNFDDSSFSFKEPVDSLNPVLLISKAALGESWWQYNYAQIPKFNNRYYFAKFVTQRGELMEYQLSVDALSTYAGQLVGKSYELERCESNKASSLLFADPERPMQANKYIVAKVIGSLDEITGGTYTLTVAGG